MVQEPITPSYQDSLADVKPVAVPYSRSCHSFPLSLPVSPLAFNMVRQTIFRKGPEPFIFAFRQLFFSVLPVAFP